MMKDNILIQGESLEELQKIPDKSIDLCFTDPPYNISQKNKIIRNYRSGKRGDINMDFGEWDYEFEPEPYLKEIKRTLKDNGSIIIWTSEQLFGRYRKWFSENMYPKQLLVWVKTNPLPQFRLVGYRQATELLYWALKKKNTKDNPNFLFQTQKEMINAFYAPIVGGKERIRINGVCHPTQKPLSITESIIKRHCMKGGVVLDPFSGTSTVAVACLKLGRKFICIEKNPKYIKMSKLRIKPFLEQTKL